MVFLLLELHFFVASAEVITKLCIIEDGLRKVAKQVPRAETDRADSRRGISASRTSSYATAWLLGGGREIWLEQDEGSLLNFITGQYSGNSSKRLRWISIQK